MAPTVQWDQIPAGTTVFDRNDEKLGRVTYVDPQSQYLQVEKGWLFIKDFYVPVSNVTQADPDGIRLNLSKDDLEDARYDEVPAADSSVYADTNASAYAGSTADPSLRANYGQQVGDLDETMDRNDIAVPVYEEEVVAGTRPQEEGRVHIHKDVVTEQQSVDVPLQRERVTVERAAFSGNPGASDDAFVERDLDIPVMGEEAVVSKRVKGVEEVRVRKNTYTDTETVSDTVRKEQVTVDGADLDEDVVRAEAQTNR